MKKKIVVVEDEPDILEVLRYNLQREGFEVLTATDGSKGLDLILKEKPALVLLDLMLPGLDGIELCKKLKASNSSQQTLIIMVSAKGAESDIVLGLGVGADDYISKPFSPRELIARVQAVLRRGIRAEEEVGNSTVEIGDLRIDVTKHRVFVQDIEVKLTATEFRLLHHLASFPGRVFSREQLLNSTVGDGVVVDRNIDVHIRGVRKKLNVDPSAIETIRGIGYRFKEEL